MGGRRATKSWQNFVGAASVNICCDWRMMSSELSFSLSYISLCSGGIATRRSWPSWQRLGCCAWCTALGSFPLAVRGPLTVISDRDDRNECLGGLGAPIGEDVLFQGDGVGTAQMLWLARADWALMWSDQGKVARRQGQGLRDGKSWGRGGWGGLRWHQFS